MQPLNRLTRKERFALIKKLRVAANNFQKLHGRNGTAILVSQTGLPTSTVYRFLTDARGGRVSMRTLKAFSIALEGFQNRVFTQPVPFRDFLKDSYGSRSEMCRELGTSRRSISNAENGLPVPRKLVLKILLLYPGRIDPMSFLVKMWGRHQGRKLTQEEADEILALGQ